MAFDVDQIFQSIDIILTQRLADLSYDTTVIATIVDDSDKSRGHYIVSDGTIKFDAYTNDTSYRVDDQVRITVINGDWSQKKFIEGKYTDGDGISAITYTPPLYTVMQDNQSTLEKIDDYVLYANYFQNESDILKPIWVKKITTDSDYYTLQANGIYNTITLQADFQTNLSNQIASGNYGLLLKLFIQSELDSNERICKYITFDSGEMIGNPYSFVIDSHQEKQITIASEGIVREMALYIYQISNFDDVNPYGDIIRNENPFMLKDGSRLNGSYGENPIWFKNIVIGFGSDLTTIENNSLHLYTTSSSTYHYNEGVGDESNDKYMGFIWYNKTEDNKYIGFSDGLKDNNYDEIEYNKVSYADSRLVAQKAQSNISTDELSLELAANYAESEIYYTKAYEALTTDLSSVFQSLGRQITGTEFYDKVSKLVSSYVDEDGNQQKAILVQYQDEAEQAVQQLAAMYAEILTYGYHKQHDTGSAEWKTEWDNADYYNDFLAAMHLAFTKAEEVMEEMDTLTVSGAELSGYRGIFNAYNPKVTKAIQGIKDTMSLIVYENKTSGEEDIVSLRDYKNRTIFTEYASADLSEYANKYAIYWYRYNEGYIPDMNSDEYKYANFLGVNWERVTVDGDCKDIINFGLPEIEDDNNPGYYPPSPENTKTLYRRMSPTAPEERYQIVLFNNHQMVKSNVITFINTEADKIPNEFKVDANDKLVIEHGAYSQDHYQSYTSAFDLVNIADETRSRQLRVSYDGVLVGDEALAGAGIYWYIPTDSTMLTYDKKYLTEKLGYIEESQDKTPRSRNGYTYFYKEIKYTTKEIDATDIDGNIIYNADGSVAKDKEIVLSEADRIFAYKIKPYYEASAQNNTIQVEAYVYGENGEQKVTTGELSLTFSTFGTNGTKYTFVLTPSSTQIAVLPDSNPDDGILDGSLNLNLSLRNADNELIAMTADPIANLNAEGDVESYEIDAYALTVGWHATPPAQSPGAITPTQITDSEQWNVNISLSNNEDKYMGIVSSKVQYNAEGKTDVDTRIIELSNLYPVPFAASENYYISGPTSIIYNNQGTVSRHNEEPFKLYSRYVDDGTKDSNGNIIFKENVLVDEQTWSLIYYDNQGNKLNADGDDYKIILSYMPKLNSDNTIMPAPMYYQYDNNEKFYIPVAICKDNNGNILWTQPIVIAQNQYASSTLNDWNGQFEINEENGTILSTMLGAGRKNENNTFEGVLIGDLIAGANFDPYNASGIGIYGFNDGAQSFYFGIDGSAFIGKSKTGRLIFDGNNGLIYSGNWLSSFPKTEDGSYEINPFKYEYNSETGERTGTVLLNPGRAGLAIDLQNGHIDAYNFKVTSNNIYLNSSPEDGSYFFRIGNNGSHIDDSHTDLDDEGAPIMTKGYMAFSKEGDLEIRANSLSLTGQLGGVNLLQQTSPKRSVPLYKAASENAPDDITQVPLTDVEGYPLFDWDVSDSNTSKWICDNNVELAGTYRNETYQEANYYNGKDFYLAVTHADENTINSLIDVSQLLEEINPSEYYTISGYVSSLLNLEQEETLTIKFNNMNITNPLWAKDKNIIKFNHSAWTRFEYTFKTPEDIEDLIITFESTNRFALWHVKLEYGSIATEWSPSPLDVEDKIAAEQQKYDIYLNQDQIFNKLITDDNGEQMDGIWLLPGQDSASGHNELFINAAYISTGILRSDNWNGVIGRIETNNKDVYGRTIYNYDIVTHPTKGVYFNLNEGKLWAAKFELDATNGTANGLYLNSHVESTGKWFYLGDGNNYINFGKNSGTSYLQLKVQNNFTLETTGTNAIYLSNTAKAISVPNSATTDKFVLAIGTSFAVTDTGKLYANGARISGNLYSSSGEIGGWIIDTNELRSKDGSISLNSNTNTISGGTVSGAVFTGGTVHGSKILGGTLDIGGTLTKDSAAGSGAFSVDASGNIHIGKKGDGGEYPFSVSSSGDLVANSGKIGGWTVTEQSIESSDGVTFDSSAGIISDNWTSTLDGATAFTDLIVTNTFVVTSADLSSNSAVRPSVTADNTIFGVDSSGNIKFQGNITLGKDKKSGYTGGDTGMPSGDTNVGNNGYVTIVIDTPWQGGAGYATFYNGILCGWHYKKGKADDFIAWLFGKDSLENGLGSATRPIYIKKDGTADVIDRGTVGQLYMGQGTAFDPQWITVTGYDGGDSYPTRFALSHAGKTNDANNCKFYVNVPAATASAYGTVKTGYTTDSDNRNYAVKINNGNLYVNVPWKNTTYDTSDFASASHSHSGYQSKYSSSVELTESSNSYMYAVVCNKASPNTLYRYASTIGTVASSARYKYNIQPLVDSSILYSLEPVQFQYKNNYAVNNNIRYGFIAEEVEKFAPNLVEKDADDDSLCNAIYPDSILTLAVAEIQKLRKEIDELKQLLTY